MTGRSETAGSAVGTAANWRTSARDEAYDSATRGSGYLAACSVAVRSFVAGSGLSWELLQRDLSPLSAAVKPTQRIWPHDAATRGRRHRGALAVPSAAVPERGRPPRPAGRSVRRDHGDPAAPARPDGGPDRVRTSRGRPVGTGRDGRGGAAARLPRRRPAARQAASVAGGGRARRRRGGPAPGQRAGLRRRSGF